MTDQISGPTTTATSAGEGRLKVGASCCGTGKKKCLKCAIAKADGKGGCGKKKKDGKGGLNVIAPAVAAGYGGAPKAAAFPSPAMTMTSKPHVSGSSVGGVAIKGIKKLKNFSTASKSKMNFGKALVGSTKSSGLKGVLKSLI